MEGGSQDMNRLREKYNKEVVPKLIDKYKTDQNIFKVAAPGLANAIEEDNKVEINNLLHNIVKINGIIHNINLKTNYTNNCLVKLIYLPYILSLKTTLNNKISVSAGLVCTASIGNDLELWWCDGWKMLWNNKIKALWPEG